MKVSIVSAYLKWKKTSFLICEIRKKKGFLTYFNRMIHFLVHCCEGMLKHNLQSTINKSTIKWGMPAGLHVGTYIFKACH